MQKIEKLPNRFVVLGGGESGVGAAVLAKVKGFDVFLSDAGKIPEKYLPVLKKYDIPFEEGGHTEELILNASEVVKSPGIPPTAPLVVKLREAGTSIISEIEFGARYTNAKMVCITGSNGKTTTTSLIYHILSEAGFNVGLAGNIGRSLALQVAEENHDIYVIELSSFQLENMYDFKANVAVILNITPDHLDRYDYKMENYVKAKLRILRNQTKDDYFIYWLDDPIVRKQIQAMQTEAMALPFSEFKSEETAAYLEEGIVKFVTPVDRWEIPRDELSLPGLHNLYNSMAAGLSTTVVGCKATDIVKGLGSFASVEHRLEPAGEVDGVKYINDSKATNVNSTYYALESMTSPVVLILGGKDKGNDYTEIEDLVRRKVKAIVCMGKDNTKLLDFFSGKVPEIISTSSVEDAVAQSAALASAGDVVLLSPCCASFDLFKSYEDRGRQFKEQVKNLSKKKS